MKAKKVLLIVAVAIFLYYVVWPIAVGVFQILVAAAFVLFVGVVFYFGKIFGNKSKSNQEKN